MFTATNHPYFVNHLLHLPSPTEQFLRNIGPRLHHLAVASGEVEGKPNIAMWWTPCATAAKRLDVVGSKQEGLRQIFFSASEYSSLIIEYVQRFGDFQGFFTKDNVAGMGRASGVEESLKALQAEGGAATLHELASRRTVACNSLLAPRGHRQPNLLRSNSARSRLAYGTAMNAPKLPACAATGIG